MSTNPSYVDPFENTLWFEMEEINCPCQGDGHANINEEWEECPIHYHGQLHPQSRVLLLDDPITLLEVERVSILNWKIGKVRAELLEHQEKVRNAQHKLFLLELEIINKTPTIKLEAIKIPEKCYPTVEMRAVKSKAGK